MLSFVIPARNAGAILPRTLVRVVVAARLLGEAYEIILVDDGSTDETAAIATLHGAKVLYGQGSDMAAARNLGARVASGEFLLFVEADAAITPEVVRAAWRVLRIGAVGGAATALEAEATTATGRFRAALTHVARRVTGKVASGFVFCTRNMFELAGGFDEGAGAASTPVFIQTLKSLGRFVVVAPGVTRLDDGTPNSAA